MTPTPEAATVEAPSTRRDPAGIYTYLDGNQGVALALELGSDGAVTAALAICSPRDQFSRKRAQKILRARLATRRFKSTDKSRVVLTFKLGTYEGAKFKEEVFAPIMDYVRETAYLYVPRNDERRYNRRKLLREFVEQITKIRLYDQAHLT